VAARAIRIGRTAFEDRDQALRGRGRGLYGTLGRERNNVELLYLPVDAVERQVVVFIGMIESSAHDFSFRCRRKAASRRRVCRHTRLCWLLKDADGDQ